MQYLNFPTDNTAVYVPDVHGACDLLVSKGSIVPDSVTLVRGSVDGGSGGGGVSSIKVSFSFLSNSSSDDGRVFLDTGSDIHIYSLW